MNRNAETLTPQLARRMGQALMRSLAETADAGDVATQAGVSVLVEPAATASAPALLAARHPGGRAHDRKRRP